MNSQGYFPFGLNGWICLQSKGFSRVFSSTTVQKHQFFGTQLSLQCNSHICIWLLENHSLTIGTFVGKLMSLLFNRLSRFVRPFLPRPFFFVRAFLPRRRCLLISWLLSPSAVLLELKKRQSVTASTFPPSICREVMRPDAVIFVFWMLSFKPAFSWSFLAVSRGSLVPLQFMPLEWYHLYFWSCWYVPSYLDYSLWFIQPGISHDVLCMEVK